MRKAAAERAEAKARREQALWMAKNAPCGCGRDYLTVPLERAHLCPRPIVTPRLWHLYRYGYSPGT